jgi:hypothetical protein
MQSTSAEDLMLAKLPRRLAFIGVGICALYLTYSIIDGYFNLWGLPTTAHPSYYIPPMIYYWIQSSVYFFCPAIIVLQFIMWVDLSFSIIGWIVTAAVNAVLYFWIGKLIVFIATAVSNRRRAVTP